MSAHKPHDKSARLRAADLPASAAADVVSTARRGFLRTTTAAAGRLTDAPADAPTRCPTTNEETST